MAKTLIEVWNEHITNGTCDKEFSNWCAFRSYCLKNSLKAESFADAKMLAKPKPKQEQKPKATDPVPKAPAASTTKEEK